MGLMAHQSDIVSGGVNAQPLSDDIRIIEWIEPIGFNCGLAKPICDTISAAVSNALRRGLCQNCFGLSSPLALK